MSCKICLEDYKGRVKPVVCQYCPSSNCRKCLERYLLQTYEDPHCVTCKRGWTPEFMAANFTLGFRGTELRKHRRQILFEREKSFLPSMQVYVEAKRAMVVAEAERVELYKGYRGAADSISERFWAYMTQYNSKRGLYSTKKMQIENQKAEIKRIEENKVGDVLETVATKLKAARSHLEQLRIARGALLKEIDDLKEANAPLVEEHTQRENDINAVHRRIRDAHELYSGVGAATAKREFIMKCGADECRGFLSTAYKCGVCETWTCPDCLVVLGKDKTVEHTCKPDMVESAKAIKAETQPCPKCAARIFKVDGCFAKDTPVLLWNGTSKMSQDICVGDELVGDDGQKRIVEDTRCGEDEMYEVTQTRGDSYTVNSKHKLVLKSPDQSDVIEVVVDDYMTLPAYSKTNLYGYKAGSNVLTPISVTAVGRGTYYGWSVSGNKRFVLQDQTVVRNCDQMWCTMEGCNTAFSWKTGHVVTGVVHNPHYYEWLRRNGGAAGPAREAGDIPCGGIPNYWTLLQAFRAARILPGESVQLELVHRNLVEFGERLTGYPARMPQLLNKEINVEYLMNKITEAEWKRQLEFTEAKFERKKEIGQILQTLVTAAADLMNQVANRCQGATDKNLQIALRIWLTDTVLPELEGLRAYTNQAFKDLAVRNHMAVPQIADDWQWIPIRALYRKKKEIAAGPAVATDEPPPLDMEGALNEIMETG